MITTLIIFIIFSVWWMYKRRIALDDLDNCILKRTIKKEKVKKINKRTIIHIFGYSIGSILLLLSIFFICCYFYFPIEYSIKSDSTQETIALSGVQYNENTLFYVAQDEIDGKDKYYYFTIKDNERWMETLDIEKSMIKVIGENDLPEIEKEIVTYSIIPTYRNKILSFIIHDFGFSRLDYFQPKQEDVDKQNIREERYIIKIPSKDIPKININTLHFQFNKI